MDAEGGTGIPTRTKRTRQQAKSIASEEICARRMCLLVLQTPGMFLLFDVFLLNALHHFIPVQKVGFQSMCQP